MDLSQILPLLLKNGGSDTAALLQAMQSGSEADLIAAVMGKNASPEMAAVLSGVMGNRQHTKKAEGLSPVLGFIDNDNLGILTKYFA